MLANFEIKQASSEEIGITAQTPGALYGKQNQNQALPSFLTRTAQPLTMSRKKQIIEYRRDSIL